MSLALRAVAALVGLVATTPAHAVGPAPPAEPIAVFPSMRAAVLDQASATVEAPVLRQRGALGWNLNGGSLPVASLDLRHRDARALGKVAAFRDADGRTWVSPRPVLPTRTAEFYPLEVHGEHGAFDARTCTNASSGQSGIAVCTAVHHVVDLRTGALTVVDARTLPTLLEEAPDLRAAYDAEHPKTAEVVERYLAAWLSRGGPATP